MNTPAWNGPAACRRTKRSGGWQTVWLVPLLFAVLMLSSCSLNRRDIKPPVEVPEAFGASGTAVVGEKWWTSFGDATLDSLIEEALEGNFSLRVAWDRLDQARAAAAASGASLWPSLDATAGAGRSATHGDRGGTRYSTDLSLGLAASYEVDLWGRVRSTRDAAVLDAAATQQDLQAAAITLAADVGRTWFRLVEQRAQLKLLTEQIETNQKYLDAITLQFRRGQVGATDVLQQRQLVEATKGDRVLVEASIEVLSHQLAVLVGRTPGSLEIPPPESLPEVPPLPATGLPAEWLRRRPDIQAARMRVAAADRRVAAAIADQWPRLGLTLGATTTDEQVRDLFDNWMASLAANLTGPLLDGGRRRAQVQRTKAAASEALNAYGQVVLTSLAEVADALSQEARQVQYVQSLHEQSVLSAKAKDRTLANYAKGTADFTRYLTALLSYQRLDRSSLQARRDLLLLRVDLYRALAGGWESPHPKKAEISQMN